MSRTGRSIPRQNKSIVILTELLPRISPGIPTGVTLRQILLRQHNIFRQKFLHGFRQGYLQGFPAVIAPGILPGIPAGISPRIIQIITLRIAQEFSA